MQSGLDPEAMQGIAQAQLSQLTARTALGWLLGGVLGGLGIAAIGGATASVVRDLGMNRHDLAATFA